MLLTPDWLNAAADEDPRVAQVLAQTIGVDMHNHVYPAGTEPRPRGGQPRRKEEPQPGSRAFPGGRAETIGVTAVCASFVLDFAPNVKHCDARDYFLHWLNTNTAAAHLGGLTTFGAEVVKECNRLGIVVDMAHASHETVMGALKVATQTLVVSHTRLDSRTGGT